MIIPAPRNFSGVRIRHREQRTRTLTAFTLAATLLSALDVWAADTGKSCVAKAHETVLGIAGLVVKGSRTRPVSPAILASWRGQSKPIIVDVDVETSGDAQTFSYLCVVTQGAAFVQRTMN